MSWQNEWKAIEGLLKELDNLSSLYLKFQAVKTGDTYGANKNIFIPFACKLADRIWKFRKTYKSLLTKDAIEYIDSKENEFKGKLGDSSQDFKGTDGLLWIITFFKVFKADVNYLLNDLSGNALRITERAFLHLQRSIVADPTIREKWANAYTENEESCEKLGATHMLSHGIWCFKATSPKTSEFIPQSAGNQGPERRWKKDFDFDLFQ